CLACWRCRCGHAHYVMYRPGASSWKPEGCCHRRAPTVLPTILVGLSSADRPPWAPVSCPDHCEWPDAFVAALHASGTSFSLPGRIRVFHSLYSSFNSIWRRNNTVALFHYGYGGQRDDRDGTGVVDKQAA